MVSNPVNSVNTSLDTVGSVEPEVKPEDVEVTMPTDSDAKNSNGEESNVVEDDKPTESTETTEEELKLNGQKGQDDKAEAKSGAGKGDDKVEVLGSSKRSTPSSNEDTAFDNNFVPMEVDSGHENLADGISKMEVTSKLDSKTDPKAKTNALECAVDETTTDQPDKEDTVMRVDKVCEDTKMDVDGGATPDEGVKPHVGAKPDGETSEVKTSKVKPYQNPEWNSGKKQKRNKFNKNKDKETASEDFPPLGSFPPLGVSPKATVSAQTAAWAKRSGKSIAEQAAENAKPAAEQPPKSKQSVLDQIQSANTIAEQSREDAKSISEQAGSSTDVHKKRKLDNVAVNQKGKRKGDSKDSRDKEEGGKGSDAQGKGKGGLALTRGPNAGKSSGEANLPIEMVGDLLEQYWKNPHCVIVHQTNCETKYAKGLADIIFKNIPGTNVYSDPSYSGMRKPGTILETKRVIHLFGQNKPGGAKGKGRPGETPAQRVQWFQSGLNKLTEHVCKTPQIDEVCFPDHIGCGRAGGDWKTYKGMISKFTKDVNVSAKRAIQVLIIKIPM